jgi:hypothetical protein
LPPQQPSRATPREKPAPRRTGKAPKRGPRQSTRPKTQRMHPHPHPRPRPHPPTHAQPPQYYHYAQQPVYYAQPQRSAPDHARHLNDADTCCRDICECGDCAGSGGCPVALGGLGSCVIS